MEWTRRTKRKSFCRQSGFAKHSSDSSTMQRHPNPRSLSGVNTVQSGRYTVATSLCLSSHIVAVSFVLPSQQQADGAHRMRKTFAHHGQRQEYHGKHEHLPCSATSCGCDNTRLWLLKDIQDIVYIASTTLRLLTSRRRRARRLCTIFLAH